MSTTEVMGPCSCCGRGMVLAGAVAWNGPEGSKLYFCTARCENIWLSHVMREREVSKVPPAPMPELKPRPKNLAPAYSFTLEDMILMATAYSVAVYSIKRHGIETQQEQDFILEEGTTNRLGQKLQSIIQSLMP